VRVGWPFQVSTTLNHWDFSQFPLASQITHVIFRLFLPRTPSTQNPVSPQGASALAGVFALDGLTISQSQGENVDATQNFYDCIAQGAGQRRVF
jgi:hypothetical protein